VGEYILLMRDDASREPGDWDAYIEKLSKAGCFQGGSEIGEGICVRKRGPAAALSDLVGYIRVEAGSLDDVKALLQGNPHYEAGGTVEIRDLPKTK
jgi:hypothetical protein